MWATSKTDATQWNIQNSTTLDSIWKGSSSVRYLSTSQCQGRVAKAVQHWPIPGLYSGIFAIYLQHHGSQQSTDRAKNIFFYALWGLYALTAATIIIEILQFCWDDSVSGDDNRCSTLFQLVVQIQNVETVYSFEIIQATMFACCDFMAQTILVCPTGNGYYHLSNSSKDISLLDCLGLQHSCCDCSVILSIRILRSIDLSSFTIQF